MSGTDDEKTASWHKVISDFFLGLGMSETSKCFDTELLVLSDYYRQQLPEKLEALADQLIQALERHVEAKEDLVTNPLSDSAERLLIPKRRRTDVLEIDEEQDEAKELNKRLDPEQVQIRATNAEIQQRINTYIKAKQSNIDSSNRTEFLEQIDRNGADASCARTDAREINRNIQMKLDIVNNEDGPLARSLLSSEERTNLGSQSNTRDVGAEERIRNIEDHLNVKFDHDSNPPFTLFERIKILENTLMEIERRYPQWAAVHFNQPNRTFPPPPPVTYINRPTNPAESATMATVSESDGAYVATQVNTSPPSLHNVSLKQTGRANSSLTRAVIEQLNRQRSTTVTGHTLETSHLP